MTFLFSFTSSYYFCVVDVYLFYFFLLRGWGPFSGENQWRNLVLSSYKLLLILNDFLGSVCPAQSKVSADFEND